MTEGEPEKLALAPNRPPSFHSLFQLEARPPPRGRNARCSDPFQPKTVPAQSGRQGGQSSLCP